MRTASVVVLLCLTVATACGGGGTDGAAPEPGGAVELLGSGDQADHDGEAPLCVLALDREALQQLADLVGGDASPLDAEPPVLGVFLGQRPTGGYAVSVTSVEVTDGTAIATVTTSQPPPDAVTTQVLTSPWVLVDLAADVTRARTTGDLELTCGTEVPGSGDGSGT